MNQAPLTFSFRRCFAFLTKEMVQVFRDMSSILIAVVLPLLLLFLFGYGTSLDANVIRVGVLLEDTSPEARLFSQALSGTKYFDVTFSLDRQFLLNEMVESRLRGVIVIPDNFSVQSRKQLFSESMEGLSDLKVQIIGDGSETNTASFVQNYADGVLKNWINELKAERYQMASQPITTQPRTWFNPELKSRNTLLSGSIAITMTLIGILLTSLVVAREWERGTMEAVLSTPILISEFLLGKLAPYFILGIGSMILCFLVTTVFFKVPFLGSHLLLLLSTAIFLTAGLGVGLLISTAAKNQFVATQLSLFLGFLPSFMLSGFLYEINSMPLPIQIITYFLPARYFVSILQTLFLAGDVWPLIVPNLLYLSLLSLLLFKRLQGRLKKNLD